MVACLSADSYDESEACKIEKHTLGVLMSLLIPFESERGVAFPTDPIKHALGYSKVSESIGSSSTCIHDALLVFGASDGTK